MTECLACGHSLRPEQRFCSECGTPAVVAGPPRCSACGEQIAETARFCRHCGTPTGGSTAVPDTGAESWTRPLSSTPWSSAPMPVATTPLAPPALLMGAAPVGRIALAAAAALVAWEVWTLLGWELFWSGSLLFMALEVVVVLVILAAGYAILQGALGRRGALGGALVIAAFPVAVLVVDLLWQVAYLVDADYAFYDIGRIAIAVLAALVAGATILCGGILLGQPGKAVVVAVATMAATGVVMLFMRGWLVWAAPPFFLIAGALAVLWMTSRPATGPAVPAAAPWVGSAVPATTAPGPAYPAGPPAPAYPATGPAPMAAVGTNGFAIASLVLGLAGGSCLSLIFGFVALSQIRRNGGEGRGMAIAGIILSAFWGLVAIGLIAFGLVLQSQSY